MATAIEYESEFISQASLYAGNLEHRAFIDSRLPNSGKTLQEICEIGEKSLNLAATSLAAEFTKELATK